MIYLIVSLVLSGLLALFVSFRDPKRLNRFPNAFPFSAFTDFGLVYQHRSGFVSQKLHKLHMKHPIIRVAPDSLSLCLSSPDAIRKLYGHSTPCVKGGLYETISPAGSPKSLLDEVNKTAHSQKRRVLSHAFATRNLETWQHKVNDKVDRLFCQFDRICDSASEKGLAVVNFTKWANLFTIEAIADIALSQELGCIERGDDAVSVQMPTGEKKEVHYIESLHADRRASSTFVWSSRWFRLIKMVLSNLPGFYGSQWRKGADFVVMLRYFTKRRVQRFDEGEDLDDLVASLLQDKNGRPRDTAIGEIDAEVSLFCKSYSGVE